jgi:hypothetical protein
MRADASASEGGATKLVTGTMTDLAADSWEFHMRAWSHLGKHILVGLAKVFSSC